MLTGLFCFARQAAPPRPFLVGADGTAAGWHPGSQSASIGAPPQAQTSGWSGMTLHVLPMLVLGAGQVHVARIVRIVLDAGQGGNVVRQRLALRCRVDQDRLAGAAA